MSDLLNPFEKLQIIKTITVTDEEELRSIYEKLLIMDISSEEKILNFQKQRDLIEMHNVNEMAESYFLMTTDVANEKNKKRKEHYEQVISPINREYDEKLNRKFLESVEGQKLGAPFDILRRNQKNDIELFCKENQELLKEISQLSSELTEIQGKMMADWKGEKVPLSVLYPYLESTDRQLRKEAYEASCAIRLEVSNSIDEIFDKLLLLRQRVAINAGFENYTKYCFKELQRFDWGESHCFEFHAAVKKHILPLRDKLLEKRRAGLQLDSLKPYDMNVDIYGREPLQIYEEGDSETLIEGAGKIIKAIDSELYGYFCKIRENKLLDLDSRENKAPGGYMVMYPIYEQASVFYNGTGLADDLMVLLHELGHCFHYFLGKDIRPYALQNWTPEVAEGGSMSMEYIGLEKMDEYLDPEKCKRIKEDRLVGIIDLFSSCAKVDEFQHWLYAHPGHSSQMRREKWIELNRIYSRGIDLKEYEEQSSRFQWQFSHILQMPYYYIDYAISELLALSIWDRYKANPEDGIACYKKGCSTGASKTVPEIYKMFGTKLSFGEEVIAPLAKRLESELGLS